MVKVMEDTEEKMKMMMEETGEIPEMTGIEEIIEEVGATVVAMEVADIETKRKMMEIIPNYSWEVYKEMKLRIR